MSPATHRIGVVRFELETGGRAEGQRLQQRVSAFGRGQFPSLVQDACDGVGRDLALGELTIDVGELPAERLEATLAQRIAERLGAALVQARESAEDLPDARTEALERFLCDGERLRMSDDPLRELDQLLTHAPDMLLALLRRIGTRQAVRKRLATQLGEDSLERLIALLEPAHVATIVACLDDLHHAQRAAPLTPHGPRALRAAAWEFVLCYLLVERGSRFNALSFADSLLRQTASRFALGYVELLDMLVANAHAIPFSQRAALPGLLAELRERELQTASPAPASAPSVVDAFAYFLRHGVLGVGAQAREGDAASLLVRALDEQPDRLRAMLADLGRAEQVRWRLASRMPEALIGRVLRLLEPHGAEPITADVRSLRRMQEGEALVPQDGAEFARVLWKLVLDYLLCERGSQFNRRSFVEGTLRALAARYGLRYEAVLMAALACLPRAGAGSASSLASLLLSLSEAAWLGEAEAQSAMPLLPADLPQQARVLEVPALIRRLRDVPDAARDEVVRTLARRKSLAPELVLGLRSALRTAVRTRDAGNVADAVLLRALAGSVAGPAAMRLLESIVAALCARLSFAPRTLLRAMAAASRVAGVRLACEALLARLEPRPVPRSRDIGADVALRLLRDGRLDGGEEPCAVLDAFFADPVRAVAALRKAGPTPAMIRRLLSHSPRAAIRMLLRQLCPGLEAQLHVHADPLFWERALSLLFSTDGEELSAHQVAESVRTAMLQQEIAGPPTGPQAPWARRALMAAHEADAAGALQCYLQSGVLPRDPSGHPRSVQSCVDTLEAKAGKILQRLLEQACCHPVERARLARALAPALRERLLRLLLGAHARAGLACLEALLAEGIDRAEAAETLLAALAGGRFDVGHVLETAQLRFGFLLSERAWEDLRRMLPSSYRHALRRAERRAALRAIVPLAASTPRQSIEVDLSATLATPMPDGALVGNAGLVLLWPFLERYFHALGMTDGAALRDPQRAAHLLQYLASGSVTMPEEGLALNKVLCGLGSADVLAPGAPPSEQEAALSDQLLRAVTQNWSALKQSTIDTLRQTFLLRDARLTRRPDGWLLTVAAGQYDMLLQLLTWNLAVVRLPWMKELLWVEWKR